MMSDRRKEWKEMITDDIPPIPAKDNEQTDMDLTGMIDLFLETTTILKSCLKDMGFEEEYQVQLIRTFFESWI